jgi:hypothetical protein
MVKRGENAIAERPLTARVVGAALTPPLAAIDATAVLVAECSIEIERGE